MGNRTGSSPVSDTKQKPCNFKAYRVFVYTLTTQFDHLEIHYSINQSTVV